MTMHDWACERFLSKRGTILEKLIKYEFIDEVRVLDDHILHRIRAVRNFGNVKKGDLGGFIESGHNLGHLGKCWVTDDACVYREASVYDDALIKDSAVIFENAFIYRDAVIGGNAKIGGFTTIKEGAINV